MPREEMPEFSRDELRQFLTAVDANLRKKAEIRILGGSAIALYGVDVGTSDIDTFETDLRPLKEAIRKAQEQTRLDIPVSPHGGAVGDWPYHSDDRLVQVMPELRRLKVCTLEKHDLALTKAVRGYENDMDAVAALHQQQPLDQEILVHRYVTEMSQAIGDPSRLDDNFARLVERLFGEIKAADVREQLQARRRK